MVIVTSTLLPAAACSTATDPAALAVVRRILARAVRDTTSVPLGALASRACGRVRLCSGPVRGTKPVGLGGEEDLPESPQLLPASQVRA